MSISTRIFSVVGVIAIAALVCYAHAGPADRILWLDFDMKNIPEPKARESGVYDYFFKGQIVEHAKQTLDVPRWVRLVTGHPKQASNVNALDEVPDSSWYTNRHYLHPMTIEALVRGPNAGNPPDFSHATITKSKEIGRAHV